MVLIEKTVFPLKKGIFVLSVSVSLFASPFSISLSLSLSLSLSCYSSSFLIFFFFCFLLFPLFVSFFLCLVSLRLFHEKNNINTLNYNVFSLQSFLFCFILSCFSFKSLFLIFVFPFILSCVSCSTSMFFFQKGQVEQHQFLVKRGLQQNVFNNLSFAKCEEFLFFGLFGKFWLMFKNTIKYVFQYNF